MFGLKGKMSFEGKNYEVTAYIMAKNEGQRIARCIDSLKWCDVILVADTGSSDDTIRIALEKGCQIIEIPFQGFGPTRNKIIDQIQTPWIVCFDADEVCSPELALEIREAIETSKASAFLANRLTFLMGSPIKHSGWNPDFRHAVLFRKGYYRYTERNIHESFKCSGNVERLHSVFYHYSFPSLSSMLAKEKSYSELGARELLKSGKKITLCRGFWHGIWAFFRHYFIKKGFLDGWRGVLIASSSAHSTFFRYAIAYELKRNKKVQDKLL